MLPGSDLHHYRRCRGPFEGAVGLRLIGRYLVHPDLNRIHGGTLLDHGRPHRQPTRSLLWRLSFLSRAVAAVAW